MRYKKNKTSLFELVLRSDWKFSATLAAIIYVFSFVLLPSLTPSNIVAKSLMPPLQSLSSLLIGFLSIIAVFKFLKSIVLKSKQTSSTDYLNSKTAPINTSNADASRPKRATHVFAYQQQMRDAGKVNSKNIHNLPSSAPKAEQSEIFQNSPILNSQFNQTNDRIEPYISDQKIIIDEIPKEEDVRDKWTLDFINSLEWKRFEDITSAYFDEIGIKNKQTGLGADGGIDLLLYEYSGEQPSAIVQCKKWSNTVGIKLLREFLGVMSHQGVAKGYFYTTDKFNQEAINFAKQHNIELVDGKTLVANLQRLSAESQYKIYKNITSGDFTTPTCVRCGSKMVLRKTDEKEFWGCKNYPKCKGVINIKAPTSPQFSVAQ